MNEITNRDSEPQQESEAHDEMSQALKKMAESAEQDDYRKRLTEKLKETSKEERGKVLEEAKETPEYQIERNKKIEGRQDEEPINDGEGVFIKKKTLYHGTTVKGIKKFKEADDATIGYGIYLTSKAEDAIGYANVRMENRSEPDPVIYECSVENFKLADLRIDKNIEKIMDGFASFVSQKIESMIESGENLRYPNHHFDALKKARKVIQSGKITVGNIREATFAIGEDFSDYIKSLDYDGLIAIEGGETSTNAKVENHDSYVIFDPEKVKIVKDQKIKKEK